MSALQLLIEAAARGIALRVVEDGLAFDAPRGELTPELKLGLSTHKQELIDLLGEPEITARAVWAASLEGISKDWEAHAAVFRAAGQEPRWLEESLDLALQADVAEAIRAGDLPRTLAAAQRWREAWVHPLEESAPPLAADRAWVEVESSVLEENVVVALRPEAVAEAQAARPDLVVYSPIEIERLHGTKDDSLVRAVHAAKKMLGGEVQDRRLATAILDEVEGRRPPPNPSVHAMFDAARARLGWRDVEERCITSWVRRHAPEVGALWPEAPLTASWLDWRRHVGAEHLAVLDEAWKSITQVNLPEKE